ncbi:uncharacterized protein B0T23DRAFT_441124 [Neurospora hispaniola]|uniref:Uncharacterized protein n=1 Tax=Neurospora hispaniola TaxID=588809 RepID=A0AAJ0IB49_9PEZI|nr:hypothetical protein B0T23DRAFT_441124 [Neurospora hispaniola]
MAPFQAYTTSTDHDQCLSSVSQRRNPHASTNGTNGTNGNPPPSSLSSSSASDLFTSTSPNDPFTTSSTTSSTTNGTSNGTSTLGGILVTTTTTTTTRNANSPLTPIPRGPVITGPSPSPLSLGSPALQPMSPTRSRSRGSSRGSDYVGGSGSGRSSARGSDDARGSSRSRGTSRGRVITNANMRGARGTPRGGYESHNGLPPVFGSGGDSEHYYNNYPLINHLYGSGLTHHGRSSRGVPRGRPRITANEGETAIRPPSYSIFTQRAMAAAAAATTAGRGTRTSRGGPGPNNNVAPPVVSCNDYGCGSKFEFQFKVEFEFGFWW